LAEPNSSELNNPIAPADAHGARGGDANPPHDQDTARNPWGLNHAVLLALLAVGVVMLFRRFGVEGMLSIGLVAVGLGFVIFIHELGHFAVAKWCDVHVETFSIGFGPAIPGCSFQRGETTYKIAWFPLGGYVKMVGEGAESEEDEDDPRSFRNKSVWQRMAIISAGVIMNVLLGIVCFIFVYRTHGVEHQITQIGQVECASPAWIKGLPAGAIIDRIGDSSNPFFDDLKYEVSLSSSDQSLLCEWHMPGEKTNHEVRIRPRKEKDDQYPVIGLAPITSVKLMPPSMRKAMRMPVTHDSAAANAQPPFEFGDAIVATTDPNNSGQVTPLASAEGSQYYEYFRRLKLLAGRPMVIEVRRQSEDKETTTNVAIQVPPSYHYVLPGLRMRMGVVTGLRENSAAARELRARNLSMGDDGDILKWLEVTDNAKHTSRYITAPPDPNEPVPPGVTRVYVDPTRLPFELQKWADEKKGDKIVRVKVLREAEHKARAPFPPKNDVIQLAWDDQWKFDREVPYSLRAPLAIPGLGIAYQVDAYVADVDKGSAADLAGLKANDQIKAVRFQTANPQTDESVSDKWVEIDPKQPDQWANIHWVLQRADYKEMSLLVESQDKTRTVFLVAQQDTTWPMADRGLVFMPATTIEKADTTAEAVRLGMRRTLRSIVMIYLNLRAMITGRVSLKSVGGPIMIATLAYEVAGQSVYDLVLFLGMISINLAVINFLPIPVLDGGHMLFLIWEKIRGVPASQTVQAVATYVGLLVILALMVLTFWVDITRLF
jgi:regulator of sigma E protease